MSDTEVSKNRPRPRDRQRKAVERKTKGFVKVTIYEDKAAGLTIVECSCGADSGVRKRRKPAEDWGERHVKKKHNDRAFWAEA